MEVSQDLPEMSDPAYILMRFRSDGEPWSEPYRISLDRLQEVMDRANAKFGNPGVDLDGPKITEPPRELPQRRYPKQR